LTYFPTELTKESDSAGDYYRDSYSGAKVSISPTFYEQLLRQNPFAKKLQT
jgi:hypothetical protein